MKDFNKSLKVMTAYQNIDQPSYCVVHLYEKYIWLCPSHDPKCSHDLYLHLLKHYSQHMWYSCQPIGVNTLQQVTSKLANMANLSSKCMNHSLHATGPTHMYETGMDEIGQGVNRAQVQCCPWVQAHLLKLRWRIMLVRFCMLTNPLMSLRKPVSPLLLSPRDHWNMRIWRGITLNQLAKVQSCVPVNVWI